MGILDTFGGARQKVTILAEHESVLGPGGVSVVDPFGDEPEIVEHNVGTGAVLEVDCTLEETHTLGADVTDHPVEVGSDISDHRRAGPSMLNMRGFVTDTPSGFLDSALEAFDPGEASRSKDAYKILQEIFDSSDLCSIITDLRLYERMVCTSYVVHRDKDSGKALHFEMAWREIRMVETKTVQVAALDVPTEPSPQPAAKQGKKATTPPQPESRSLLKQGLDTSVGQSVTNTAKGWAGL